MQKLSNWLEHRTGLRSVVHEALYERIPGGARWRYVWGSTLVFVFVVQLITGLFLWMHYSPSAQTAWESVYYIQHELPGGWLLRGIHHFAAQAMVVLLALHFMQVVIDGAYKAPREVNFWLGLVLMLLVMGLALTGYLLPWDQKGYWATQVATKIASSAPVVGEELQTLVVGGPEYGHQTLTRFFALHAGLLPALLVAVLAAHLTLFRRHSLTPKLPLKRPDGMFWPDQILRDSVACLAVLATILGLTYYFGAELGAPANPAESYDTARPEWYFLFLFQFLKFFHGENGIVIGAIVIPTAVLVYFFLMPLIGRIRVGHWLNVAVLLLLLAGAGWLTYDAIREDYGARWVAEAKAEQLRGDPAAYVLGETSDDVKAAIEQDLSQNGQDSPYYGKPPLEQFQAYFEADGNARPAGYEDRVKEWQAFQKSQGYLAAVEAAHAEAVRARELAAEGIPPVGALSLLQHDPMTQGPKLFRRHCASCHSHMPPPGDETAAAAERIEADDQTASNLYRFASRAWTSGILDPERIATPHYFGNTPFAEGEMGQFVQDVIGEFGPDVEDVAFAVSAEAALPAQAEADQADAERIARGRAAMVEVYSCTDCHKFHDNGDAGLAPDLTGYGSRDWLLDFVGNPGHARFYGENNVMPAFFEDTAQPESNKLTRRELQLIVNWLRGDTSRPE
jgi:quinol-cytochrome oxidoreductase complex cytochrome b subunit/mono/diheme cytochrome c family protein